MSPESKRKFELEWVVLSRRLRLLLGRKGVSPNLHDDLVQETALRLLSMWDDVDPRRPLWPLTVTIALNLLRDRGRVVTKDDLVAEMPELCGVHDVEAAGLARIELERVRRAMGELSRSQRSALMKEIGSHASATAPDSSGDKMLRMRARRKLKMALENVSALVGLRLRRVLELAEAAFVAKEGAVSAASCVVCLVIGIGATVAGPGSLTPHASAASESTRSQVIGVAVSPTNGALMQASTTSTGTDEPRAGDATGSAAAGGKAASDAKPKATRTGTPSGAGGGDEGGLISVLPQDDDQVGPPPTGAVKVDGSDPPPLPDGGPDGGPAAPPVGAPPAPPPPPSPVSAGMPLPPVLEEAQDLL